MEELRQPNHEKSQLLEFPWDTYLRRAKWKRFMLKNATDILMSAKQNNFKDIEHERECGERVEK